MCWSLWWPGGVRTEAYVVGMLIPEAGNSEIYGDPSVRMSR
jgi:hypothetical protein